MLSEGIKTNMNYFVNFSNHPSNAWSDAQKKAAEKYGQIVDIQFPEINPDMTEKEIFDLGTKNVERILLYNPKAVMCQGEFTLTFDMVNKLKTNNIICLSACSKRVVIEKILEDGSSKKEAIFSFVQFRRY